MFLVVAYDCSDDKRRLRVSKILLDYGYRVQYSVFEVQVDESLFGEMTERLRCVINHEEDSVRIYRICERCLGQVKFYGHAELTNQETVFIV